MIYGISGEFNHSLKGFKIPLKENVIGNACDTPAPPGTEDIAYISPLDTVYEAPQTKFDSLLHSQQSKSKMQSQSPMAAAVPAAINNVDNSKVKSSSLFSKIIIIIVIVDD